MPKVRRAASSLSDHEPAAKISRTAKGKKNIRSFRALHTSENEVIFIIFSFVGDT